MPILILDRKRGSQSYQRYKWSRWEIELLNQLNQDRMPISCLAERFGVSKSQIVRELKKHGFRQNQNWTELREDLQKKLNLGLSPLEIAADWDCSPQTINRKIREFGLTRTDSPLPRPIQKWADRKAELERLVAEGKTLKDLASHYQVSLGSIYQTFYRMQIPLPKAQRGQKPLTKTPARKHNYGELKLLGDKNAHEQFNSDRYQPLPDTY